MASPHDTEHVPVLLAEVVDWLKPQAGGLFVDGTLGGGGHTRALAERVGAQGRILAFDRDPAARVAAEGRLRGLPVTLVDASFHELPEVLRQLAIPKVDGVLLDLGFSSEQLADLGRGFSFDSNGPLDLRFNPNEGRPAWEWLERLGVDELADLIFEYGEERQSRRIARRIVERRLEQPIQTAGELARLVRSCAGSSHGRQRIDPATRTFQALRIAVNDELKLLELALARVPDYLTVGGRMAVISFHSLEDRRVKEAFRDDVRFVVLTRKPVRASEAEVAPTPAPEVRNFG